jgi:hypothetical protein
MAEFMSKKSKKNPFGNLKNKTVDLKDQLAKFKEKDKARIKTAAAEKGRELTDEEIAEMMFADEAAAGSNNPLFARKRAPGQKAGDDDVSTDSSDEDGEGDGKLKKKKTTKAGAGGGKRDPALSGGQVPFLSVV